MLGCHLWIYRGKYMTEIYHNFTWRGKGLAVGKRKVNNGGETTEQNKET